MESSTDGRYRAVTRRRMPAPREIVFDAWIDPKGIHEWMCPGNVVSAEATLDVRVGGSFRLIMKGKDEDHVHIGIYQVVEPPSKLVFTWAGAGNPGGSIRNEAGKFIKADLKSLPAAAASKAASIRGEDFRVSLTNASGESSYPVASFTWLLIPKTSVPA
jgi:uncharacterized protein YndB with AHSA1/START domain